MDLKSFKDEVEFDTNRVKTKVLIEISFSPLLVCRVA